MKEKAQTRARDALAAERRRMPWMAVETAYAFEGPAGKASLLDLFDGRRQLIVYRAFFEPGVFGWPEYACRAALWWPIRSSVAHLNARDTTLVFVSRAPQADIARLKARMAGRCRGSPLTDSFDADFGGRVARHERSTATATACSAPTSSTTGGDEQMGSTWNYLGCPLGRW